MFCLKLARCSKCWSSNPSRIAATRMPRIDARFSNWRVDLGHLAVAYRQRRPKHRSQPQPGFSYTLRFVNEFARASATSTGLFARASICSVNAFVKVIGRWKAFMTDQSLVWCCVVSR